MGNEASLKTEPSEKMHCFSCNSMMKRIEKHFNNVNVIIFDPFQKKMVMFEPQCPLPVNYLRVMHFKFPEMASSPQTCVLRNYKKLILFAFRMSTTFKESEFSCKF